MNEAKRWTVVIDIDEHEGRTRAVARLHTRDTEKLVGVGLSCFAVSGAVAGPWAVGTRR